ncbi:hypothetical protein ACJJTC_014114 [Scirpophaga incertulas]
MCPIWPLHLVILYLLALCPLWVLCQQLPKMSLDALFEPNATIVHMDTTGYVDVTIRGQGLKGGDKIQPYSIDENVATAVANSSYTLTAAEAGSGTWKGRIRIYGNFLGRTNVSLKVKREEEVYSVDQNLDVTVTRPERVIDTVFTTSVALFVSLIFINFGCAMHWPTVKDVMKRPIGPAIGMVGQFLWMPLMSFGLGYLIFPDEPMFHMGMFFTGVSPGGGASNIWTFILGGNLNLSLAMTTISTLASLGFMPLWLFSLGQVVFRNARIGVPYTRILSFVVGLVVPLGIGLAMQRFTPRLAAFMVRILKGFSTTLLLFIIIFAIVTNIYIFKLFSWQIIVAGMGIPWLGYMFGYALARLCKRPHADALAISVETGIQNTGISIFLLRYALQPPFSDIATVVPVSAAIMTPVPMMCIYIYQKIMLCIKNRRNLHEKIVEDAVTPVSEAPQPDVIATINVDRK